MSVFTTEQVREYSILEDRYPDHLAPRKLEDSIGVTGLLFVIADREDEMDCGGCGYDHMEYVVILPDGMVLDSPFGNRGVISNTLGEDMSYGRPVYDNSEPVDAEDWITESVTDDTSWMNQLDPTLRELDA